MMPRWSRLSAALAGLLAVSLWGGSAGAATGLPFLTQVAGGRALALAEAAVALPADQASANPAALAPASAGVGLSHSRWIQGVRLEEFNVAAKRGKGTYGAALYLARIDGLERRTGPTAEPLGEFGVYDAILSFSYARPYNEKLRWGLSTKLIRQSIFTSTASGAAVDAGLLYRLHPDLEVGAALANVGSMGKLELQSTDLPLLGRVGVAYSGVERLLLSAQIQTVRERGGDWRLGGEYAVLSSLFLRGGYQSSANRSLSLGVGLVAGKLELDYAYLPFDRDLGEVHRFSLYISQPQGTTP
jgi:hypothetical protein